MSRVCEVCSKRPQKGRIYTRRGRAKYLGGVGIKTTGITARRRNPNIQMVRIVEDNGTVRTAKICASCLRTGVKKGTIKKAVRGRRRAQMAEAEATKE